jgi:DNA invertase Pin-like site-specific DNA recombinase
MAGVPIQVALCHRPRHHRHTLEWLGFLWPEKLSGADVTKPLLRKLRCAVYTRKSSEEGLEQEFNSLHAQREACEAYIASQRSEGWVALREQYDDGGVSGGTLERPGLKALMQDIEDGLVDVVVVYKIDRLSRSLDDFAKLVEVFDRTGVTFVSVTQQFNTTTSMGRLTLNILLSFAQFEREVTAERIRDKVAASRKKGIWMGGVPPYGYRVENRKLVIDPERAEHVRWMFARFVEIGSTTELARQLTQRGLATPNGNRMDKKYLYRVLNNRAYIGEAVHKGDSYPGEHEAIIAKETWDKVHTILQKSPRKRAANTRAETPALLKGLIYGPNGAAFSPTHTKKRGKLYRYYVSQTILKHGAGSCPIGRVPAGEIETAVIDQIRAVFRQPEIIAGAWDAAKGHCRDITLNEARMALQQFDPLWDELFPAEQARIIALAVERVDIGTDAINVRMRIDGLAELAQELLFSPEDKDAAA